MLSLLAVPCLDVLFAVVASWNCSLFMENHHMCAIMYYVFFKDTNPPLYKAPHLFVCSVTCNCTSFTFCKGLGLKFFRLVCFWRLLSQSEDAMNQSVLLVIRPVDMILHEDLMLKSSPNFFSLQVK